MSDKAQCFVVGALAGFLIAVVLSILSLHFDGIDMNNNVKTHNKCLAVDSSPKEYRKGFCICESGYSFEVDK